LLREVIEVAHLDLAEVVLRELAGHSFEAHERHCLPGPQLSDQLIERRLATCVALAAKPMQDLDCRKQRLSSEKSVETLAPGCAHAWPSHAALPRRPQIGRIRDRWLPFDPFHGAPRQARLLDDLAHSLARGQQYLNSMPGHGSDHPPSPPGGGAVDPRRRRAAAYRSPASGGQNFRKEGCQNFRN